MNLNSLTIIKNILRTSLIIITSKSFYLNGGGNSESSFIKIEDKVYAVSNKHQITNLGAFCKDLKKVMSIKNLVKLICDTNNINFVSIAEESKERFDKYKTYFLDSSKIRSQFDCTGKIYLKFGIVNTVRWVKENIKLFSEISWDYIHKT